MRKMTSAGMIPIVLMAACGGPGRIQETATTVPHRDLTLSTSSAPSTEVTSRIELAALPTTHRSKPARPATRIRVEATPETPVATPAPAAVAELAEPAPAQEAVAAPPAADANSHELAPGSTVTIVPVSTASATPSGGGDAWSEIPSPRPGGGVTIRGWPGGHCGSGGSGGRGPVSILQ